MEKQRITVVYPCSKLEGRDVVLLTSLDEWQTPLRPVSSKENSFSFEVESDEMFFHFKPCLQAKDGELTWAVGSNFLAPVPAHRVIYPSFFSGTLGRVSDKLELKSKDEETYFFRVYYPPGYEENTARSYPVCYMHDGHNLFFPEESFAGQTWEVKKTMEILDSMNSIEACIVVAI